MHLTQPEESKKNTLIGAVLATQITTFKVQLNHDRKMCTWHNLKSQYYPIGNVILEAIGQGFPPAYQCHLGYLRGYVKSSSWLYKRKGWWAMLSIMKSLFIASPTIFDRAYKSFEKVAQLTEYKMRKARLVIRAKTDWLKEKV